MNAHHQQQHQQQHPCYSKPDNTTSTAGVTAATATATPVLQSSQQLLQLNNDSSSMQQQQQHMVMAVLADPDAYSDAPCDPTMVPARTTEYVRHPLDKSVVRDMHGQPLTVDRVLATKPLKEELLTRPGPGGSRLTYLSGDAVTRTLNDIFGFDGWHLQIISTEKTVCERLGGGTNSSSSSDAKTKTSASSSSASYKWQVAYTAHVRITHRHSQCYKEDVGAGDACDRHLPTAIQHALKGAVTDAMKRAARHFGDKLGNSLYAQGGGNVNHAPKTLQQALEQADQLRQQRMPWVTNNNHNSETLAASKATPPPPTTQSINHIHCQPVATATVLTGITTAPNAIQNNNQSRSAAIQPPPHRKSMPSLPNLTPQQHQHQQQQQYRHSMPPPHPVVAAALAVSGTTTSNLATTTTNEATTTHHEVPVPLAKHPLGEHPPNQLAPPIEASSKLIHNQYQRACQQQQQTPIYNHPPPALSLMAPNNSNNIMTALQPPTAAGSLQTGLLFRNAINNDNTNRLLMSNTNNHADKRPKTSHSGRGTSNTNATTMPTNTSNPYHQLHPHPKEPSSTTTSTATL